MKTNRFNPTFLFRLTLPLLCWGILHSQSTDRKTLQIEVSIYPLQSILQYLSGDQASIGFAVPPGANPHLYEPLPSQVNRWQKADLFIAIGSGLDGWVKRFLPDKSRYHTLLGEAEKVNPHIWLSLHEVRKYTGKIVHWLQLANPAKKEFFAGNHRRFLAQLDQLDRKLSRLFAPLHNRSFILWHPSWNYFARDYNLEIAGVIESGHGDEPSLREMQELIRNARKKKVKVIVIDLNVDSRAAQSLRREIGGTLLRLDAMGEPQNPEKSDYLNLIHWNAQRLALALQKSQTDPGTP